MPHLFETVYDDNGQNHTNLYDISMDIINQLHGHIDLELISKYYDLHSYNELLHKTNPQNLNIIHVNSRSLPKNSDNIQSLLNSMQINADILAII